MHDSGEHFSVGTATGHLLFYSLKKTSKNSTFRLTDTQEAILTHSIVGHIDYVSILRYTPFGRLLSGGADSNIKVFAYFEKENLAPEYVFIKHCDEIDTIQIMDSDPNKGEIVATGDKSGTVFLWVIGSGTAQRMVHLGDDPIWVCFGNHLEEKERLFEEHSFGTDNNTEKSQIRKQVEDYFEKEEKLEGGVVSVQLYNSEYRLERYDWQNELQRWMPIKATQLDAEFERSRTANIGSDFFFLNSNLYRLIP